VFNVANKVETDDLKHLIPTSVQPEYDNKTGMLIGFNRYSVQDPGGKFYPLSAKKILWFWGLDPYVEIQPPTSYPAKAALSDFDSIAKSAKASGLSGETFQEFAYSAELGGVATDQFAKALETFSKNSGLAAEGKGRMVTQLKALNPELLKSILATTDQATRFKLAADAIDQAGTASAKAALSSVLFGDAGTRMTEVLKGGSTALDETAKKARALGLVIDNELLSNAETMSDEFATASRIMDLEFKRTMVDLAPVLISTAQLAGAVARGIGDIVDSMKALEARSTAGLEERLTYLQKGGLGSGPGNRSEGADNSAAAAEIEQIRATLRQRAINNLRDQLTAPKAITVDGGNVDLDFGAGGNAAASAAIKHGEAVQKLIADLQFERDTLRETALEQNILNTLRNAGVDATSSEGLAIRGLITDLDAQKTAIEANADAMKAFGDASADALGTFINDLIDGKDMAESFGGILKTLGSQLISAGLSSLTGSSGLGSLFGGIPGRATGGPVAAGQPYIVGEKRPELFVPSTSGRIIPKVPTPGPVPAGGGSGRGNVTVYFSPQIDATGADAAGLARVQGQLASMRAELPSVIKRTVQRRGKDMW